MSAGEAPRAIPDDPKPTTGSAFSPFRYPTFTVIWTTSVVANIGTWMYTATSSWLMTSLDPDPLTVSLVQVAASLPIFLIAIPAGALADIVDRRRFLIAGEAANTAIAAIFAALVASDLVTPNLLLVFTFLIGASLHKATIGRLAGIIARSVEKEGQRRKDHRADALRWLRSCRCFGNSA